MISSHNGHRVRLRYFFWALVTSAMLLPRITLAAGADARAHDERLKQPVTTRAVDFPLRTWLEELSRQAGVSLRTAPDEEDRALTVRVAAMPLRDLMDAVASLFGDLWVGHGKKEAPEYVLTPSSARRDRQRQFLQAYGRAWQACLTSAARAAAERLSRAGEGSPVTRDAAGCRLASLLDPETLLRLLHGEWLRVRVGDVRGEFGDALRSYLEVLIPATALRDEPDRADIWIEFFTSPYTATQPSAPGLPSLDLRWTVGGPHGQSVGDGLWTHPDEFAARLAQETESLRRGEEQAPEERRRLGGSALQRRLPADLGLPSQPQPTRSQLLMAIADKGDLNLISDAYTKPKEDVPKLAGRTIEDAMETVCARHGCFWRAEHGALLVRSRYWWLDDLDEPPATQAARWQATLEKDGRLGIDDASQIAALPPAQRGRLALRLPETRDAWNPWLRLYGQLTAPQRQVAEMPRGLLLAAIAPLLRLEIIDEPTPKSNPRRLDLGEALSGGRMALRVTREAQDGGRPAAIFLLQPLPDADGQRRGQPVSITVPLPYRKLQPPSPHRPGADNTVAGL